MSLEDSLRSFAKKPMGTKVATFAGGLAVMGLLYWQLFYSDMADERDELVRVHQAETQRNQKLKKRERDYKQLVKKNDQLKEQLIENRVSLPTSSELPSFFVHLQKQAAGSGTSIVRWKRAREVPVGTLYVKVPVNITISGTFYQILHYFKLLSETKRIITIENLSLGGARAKSDETVLTASFTASTFRLAGDGTDELFEGEPEDDASSEPAKSKIEEAREKAEAERAKRESEGAAGNAEGAEQGGTP